MKPLIKIFLYQDGYKLWGEFGMELLRNPGGISIDVYALQAIALNHLKKPVYIQAVHLTKSGVELYVSTEA